ncbi:MAG: PilZ domain-containing protein [Candidatus Eisenbacteria bacterium]|nr:PilZ domain-containing protein [Candidatus Eisenbacteria bacterium]
MARGREKERRKSKRITARLALQIEKKEPVEGEDVLIAESINMSTGGVYCRLRVPVPVLTKVVMTLLIPAFGKVLKKTHVLKCEGIVVRCSETGSGEKNGDYEVACSIMNLKKGDKELIDKYVTWKSMRSFLR